MKNDQFPLPAEESQRLETLRQYQILDTLPEADFDDLTHLASYICQAPISLISLSDTHRQWLKSSIGVDLVEIPRTVSFCQYAIMGEDVYEVPDAREDVLFADNPMVVQGPCIRFYAGAPLINPEGYKLGTLCVIDTVPRKLTESQRSALQALARQVMTQFELRLQQRKLTADKVQLENYRTFSINTTEIMCILDARTLVFEEVNDAFGKISGYQTHEVVGKALNHFIYEADLPKTTHVVRKGVTQGLEAYEFENRLVCQDGTLKWLSWNAISKDGKWFANARDVTKRHEMEEKLQESTHVILESQAIAQVGSWEYNLDTQVLSWSAETFRLFGLPPNSPAPMLDAFLKMVHPDDAPQLIRKIKEAMQYGQPYLADLRIILPDGSVRYASAKGQLKTEDDKPRKLLGTVLDITERKQTEMELLRAKEQAEKSMKAKEQFLSNMSHEIRTPLNAVIGMTHLLMQEDPQPGQLEYLRTLRFSSENLLVLINDILDFSKIEAGKITFESIDFSLHELLNGIRQSLALKAEEKGIRLTISLDTKLPNAVVGDPVRLNQILTNLISNALKFTHQGGVQVNVWVREENDHATVLDFSVIDSGIGIPADKLSAIFESFTQATADTTRKFGGTGLGLAITKRLLELQNSQIHVQSQEGTGSMFSFQVSFQKSVSAASLKPVIPHLSPLPDSLGHVNLLLVEDNEVNRLVASKFLTKWKVCVDYADNGLVALQQVQRKHYDIILMDLQMPEMDGYDATRAIRALPELYYRQIPIIALTASAMLDVKDRVFTVGMTDYLSKPFNPTDLYQKISKYTTRTEDGLASEPAQADQIAINFEGLLKTADDDLVFARQLMEICIESLNDFKAQYQLALEARDLTKLKSISHKAQPLFQSLELEAIRNEITCSQDLLQNSDATHEALAASFSRVQVLCEAATSALQKNLAELVVE